MQWPACRSTYLPLCFAGTKVACNGGERSASISFSVYAEAPNSLLRPSTSVANSGSIAARQRPGFAKLLDRMETGDVLVVTKIDRLGRTAMDVRATVEALEAYGVRVHCLALGGIDLTSPAGKMTMSVIAAVAEFERDLLIERTHAGLARAKAEGTKLGRKAALTAAQSASILGKLAAGEAVAALAREFRTSRQTIMRVRASAGRASLEA